MKNTYQVGTDGRMAVWVGGELIRRECERVVVRDWHMPGGSIVKSRPIVRDGEILLETIGEHPTILRTGV